MNSNQQSQHEQHRIAERVAHLETSIEYQGQAVSGVREEMRAGFARSDAEFVRVHAEFVRVHAQLLKIRTTDFRSLLSICLTTALGTAGLIVKIFGLLPSH